MSSKVTALRFKQWLTEWDSYAYDEKQQRRRPDPHVYLFAMPAVQLRALSGVYRRKRDGAAAEGLQRYHDEKRSKIIRDFVRYGYPFSDIKEELRTADTLSLRKPGWLPTAIVVNILTPADARRGRKIAPKDLITIDEADSGTFTVNVPYKNRTEKWAPQALEPIEIIDGQHRLWAFDEAIGNGDLPGDFELPVVAFHGLDVGWQAYLFWSINVSPKRINPSHAFDLYPLLRSQDWLETFSEIKIYREARAQELTELLYLHPQSPWHKRINMLGETAREAPEGAGVTQAGWVRALTSSFLSPGGRGRAAKGLFAADIDEDGPLGWSRAQQAAFLIEFWRNIQRHIEDQEPRWVKQLRTRESRKAPSKSAPLTGSLTMLNQEQGVRGILSVSNEIFFAKATEYRSQFDWNIDLEFTGQTSVDDVTEMLTLVRQQPFSKFAASLASGMAEFDWRSSDAPNLSEAQRLKKRAFRGSGGYVALREQLLRHLTKQGGDVASCALSLIEAKARR
ncbi:DGQHR domain-containing protein [Phenylobacterium sp.]|uniref:DGQHR domain-containing protein n=1 Tax=Phenylobacterium sp. TaxID=1871053 RepID=UPI003956D56C